MLAAARPTSFLLAIVLGTSLFTATGCKKISEKIAEKVAEKAVGAATGSDVDLDTGNGTVTMKGDNGAVVVVSGDTTTVPENWPKSVPIYPSASLKASMSGSTGDAKEHFSLTFETSDPPSKVFAFYKDNLKGFKKVSEMNLNGNIIASFEGEGKTVAITASRGQKEQKTMLNLIVANKS